MGARATGVASTRERVTRAARRLYLDQAFEDVTLASIAAAAGVSHQTVLNHFESKDGVLLAVAEMLRDETVQIRHAAPPGDVAGAIHALVDDYEQMGDANIRWIVASERVPTLAALLDEARSGHQEWLQAMFGASMPDTPAAGDRTLHALHAATDVYTWKLLRRDLRLSRTETEATIVDLVVGALRGATP